MKNGNTDFFTEYDRAQVELEQISTMLWFIYEDYYGITDNDLYTKANYYDRLDAFLYNTQNCLLKLSKEMKEKVNQEAKIRRNEI